MIVVSELVANAVRHAGLTGEDKVMLDVILLEDAVRVEVTDSGPGFDRARAAVHKPMGEGGFGLHIVSMLSRAWGVVPGRGAAWADVSVPDIIH